MSGVSHTILGLAHMPPLPPLPANDHVEEEQLLLGYYTPPSPLARAFQRDADAAKRNRILELFEPEQADESYRAPAWIVTFLKVTRDALAIVGMVTMLGLCFA